MNLSACKNMLLAACHATALVLIVVSVLAAGVAHAHVDDVTVASPRVSAVTSLHDVSSEGPVSANVMPAHCGTVASCHTLFFGSAQSATIDLGGVSIVPVPLQYSTPPALVFGLFRPPRHG